MKFDLFNQTPLSALAESRPDKQGQPALLIIAKGVWRSDTSHLAGAEAQIALRTEPLVRQIGELELDPVQKHILQNQLEQEIVWLDHEVSAPKGQFEIVIAANIREPHGQAAPYIDASVTLGEQVRMIRAHAPRYWHGNRIAQAGAGVRSVPMCHCFAHWQDSLLAQLRAPELPDLSAFVRHTALRADTLLIEPEHKRFSIIWRAHVPSPQLAILPAKALQRMHNVLESLA